MAWLEYVKKAGDDQDSLREDIPDEKRNPKARRVPGVKYFITNRYELITNRKPVNDLIKSALGDRQK